jgi:hypothetical protein
MLTLPTGQLDDRRRRVLNELAGNPVIQVQSRTRSRAGRSKDATPPELKPYGDAAFMDEQPRLTDLVPLRLSLFLIPLALGLAVIAGLEMLYMQSEQWAAIASDGRIAAFDLDAEGSLGAWFSSTILMIAGLAAILVYLIRRHRVDDYRGYYHVWLWAACSWFLMSIDEGSSLHEGFKELMARVTGTRLYGDGSLWWVIPYFFLLGAVGTRLLVDMRHCLLSSAALLGTAFCYAFAAVAQLGWIMPDEGAREVMFEEGAEMLAAVLMLLAMLLHARYVILEAKGLLPHKAKASDDRGEKKQPVVVIARKAPPVRASVQSDSDDEEEIEDQAESKLAGESSVTVHRPHTVPKPVSAAASRPATGAPVTAKPALQAGKRGVVFEPATRKGEADQGDSLPKRKLTKGERKALKQRLERMRAEREERLGE